MGPSTTSIPFMVRLIDTAGASRDPPQCLCCDSMHTNMASASRDPTNTTLVQLEATVSVARAPRDPLLCQFFCLLLPPYASCCLLEPPSTSLCLCLYLCLCLCLSDCLSVCLCLSLSVCLSVWLSVCLSVWLSVCLSVCHQKSEGGR